MFIGIGLGLGLLPPVAGFSSLPQITVTNGIITPFSRGGVLYTQVEWAQSGRYVVDRLVPWANLALGGGGGTGGRGTGSSYAPGPGGSGRLLLALGIELAAGTYDVVLGAGAPSTGTTNGQSNGSDSTLSGPLNWRAPGGGRGGSSGTGYAEAGNGGSGGGGRGGVGIANRGLAVPGTGLAGLGSDGGVGFANSDPALGCSGGSGGSGGPGGNAASGAPGAAGPGTLLDWLATPLTVCAGADGSLLSFTSSTPAALYGSGTRGTNGGTVGKAGDGFKFLVVRRDEVDVRMAA